MVNKNRRSIDPPLDDFKPQKWAGMRLPRRVNTIAEIDLQALHTCGIQGIILDLDNTIVSEDDRYLSPGAEDWIKQARHLNFQLFILSNGKRRYRVRAWANRLKLGAISPAKKPFPIAFQKACRVMQLYPQQVVVIGDSWHTDVLGARLLGSHWIQVASLPHPRRWWEVLLGRWIQYPYPKSYQLCPFHPSAYYLDS
jgi:hypothetical protein